MSNDEFNSCQLEPLQITEEAPYKNDLLDREEFGNALQDLIESFSRSDSFVIAINGKWGSGKTTFIQMWQQQMKNQEYETIYHNLWKNDYISDPLIALIAELTKLTSIFGEKKLKRFFHRFRKVSQAIAPSLASLATKKLTGYDLKELKDVIEKGTKEIINIIDSSVEDYQKQQQTIEGFRNVLTQYIALVSPDKPIIFIIDELDSCKPDFAVKTLERIKHLFSVNNIVFVLAIDREQLCNSIRGYYGSDQIDSNNYLLRFIDVPIDLPRDHSSRMVNKVLDCFSFSSLFNDKNKFSEFKSFIRSLYGLNNMSIRQLEKWMIQTRIYAHRIKLVHPLELTAYLLYLYDFDTDFYHHLMNNDLSDLEILNHLMTTFPNIKSSSDKMGYKIMAYVLQMKYFDNDVLFHANIIDKNGNFILPIDKAIIDENELRAAFNSNEKTIPLHVAALLREHMFSN